MNEEDILRYLTEELKIKEPVAVLKTYISIGEDLQTTMEMIKEDYEPQTN